MDKKRSLAFKDAIYKIISTNDIVADIGTGSGILALFAAEAGAKKVYAVEFSPYLGNIARKIFIKNGFEDVIICINKNAFDVEFKENIDVVISEIITTGLIDELQAPILNNLFDRGIINEGIKIIPSGIDVTIELVNSNYDFYGFQIYFPKYQFFDWDDNINYILSNKEKIISVDFSRKFNMNINKKLKFIVMRDGIINGLQMKSSTKFKGSQNLEQGCFSYCQPIIFPINDIIVKRGDTIEVKIRYEMGMGFDHLEYKVKNE